MSAPLLLVGKWVWYDFYVEAVKSGLVLVGVGIASMLLASYFGSFVTGLLSGFSGGQQGQGWMFFESMMSEVFLVVGTVVGYDWAVGRLKLRAVPFYVVIAFLVLIFVFSLLIL